MDNPVTVAPPVTAKLLLISTSELMSTLEENVEIPVTLTPPAISTLSVAVKLVAVTTPVTLSPEPLKVPIPRPPTSLLIPGADVWTFVVPV